MSQERDQLITDNCGGKNAIGDTCKNILEIAWKARDGYNSPLSYNNNYSDVYVSESQRLNRILSGLSEEDLFKIQIAINISNARGDSDWKSIYNSLEYAAVATFLIGASTGKGGRPIRNQNGFYTVDGMKIEKSYYERLWNNKIGGRPAPFLQAEEILNDNPVVTPDPRGAPGYFKYEAVGLEMIYNPKTGQIGHIQPTR